MASISSSYPVWRLPTTFPASRVIFSEALSSWVESKLRLVYKSSNSLHSSKRWLCFKLVADSWPNIYLSFNIQKSLYQVFLIFLNFHELVHMIKRRLYPSFSNVFEALEVTPASLCGILPRCFRTSTPWSNLASFFKCTFFFNLSFIFSWSVRIGLWTYWGIRKTIVSRCCAIRCYIILIIRINDNYILASFSLSFKTWRAYLPFLSEKVGFCSGFRYAVLGCFFVVT